MCISNCAWSFTSFLALRLLFLLFIITLVSALDYWRFKRFVKNRTDLEIILIVSALLMAGFAYLAWASGCSFKESLCSLGLNDYCTKSAFGQMEGC
jgi:hypothetical protein